MDNKDSRLGCNNTNRITKQIGKSNLLLSEENNDNLLRTTIYEPDTQLEEDEKVRYNQPNISITSLNRNNQDNMKKNRPTSHNMSGHMVRNVGQSSNSSKNDLSRRLPSKYSSSNQCVLNQKREICHENTLQNISNPNKHVIDRNNTRQTNNCSSMYNSSQSVIKPRSPLPSSINNRSITEISSQSVSSLSDLYNNLKSDVASPTNPCNPNLYKYNSSNLQPQPQRHKIHISNLHPIISSGPRVPSTKRLSDRSSVERLPVRQPSEVPSPEPHTKSRQRQSTGLAIVERPSERHSTNRPTTNTLPTERSCTNRSYTNRPSSDRLSKTSSIKSPLPTASTERLTKTSSTVSTETRRMDKQKLSPPTPSIDRLAESTFPDHFENSHIRLTRSTPSTSYRPHASDTPNASRRPNVSAKSANVSSTSDRPNVSAKSVKKNPQSSWSTPPLSTTACTSHHRPVLCLALDDGCGLIVSGSADHSLRVHDYDGQLVKELYSKRAGHKEWVTACAILPSGVVLSGGMDGAGCVWETIRSSSSGLGSGRGRGRGNSFNNRNISSGRGSGSGSAKCMFVGPHSGTVSYIGGNGQGHVLTGSYDCSVKLWDIGLGLGGSYSEGEVGLELLTLASEAPVTSVSWNNDQVVVGDRFGGVGLWDLEKGLQTHIFQSNLKNRNNYNISHNSGKMYSLPSHNGRIMKTKFLTDTPGSSEYWENHGVGVGVGVGSGYTGSRGPWISLSVGADGFLRVWDERVGVAVVERQFSHNTITDLDTTNRLAVSNGNSISNTSLSDVLIGLSISEGRSSVVDPRAGFKTLASYAGHKAPAVACRFSPDGASILSTDSLGKLLSHKIYHSSVLKRRKAILSDIDKKYLVITDNYNFTPSIPDIPVLKPSWGMCVSQGPITDEAKVVVGGGDGGKMVGCMEVGQDIAVVAGDDGTPLILHFS